MKMIEIHIERSNMDCPGTRSFDIHQKGIKQKDSLHKVIRQKGIKQNDIQTWTNFSWQDEPWAEFQTLEVAACHAMHLLHSIAIQPNLELKTWLKQLLGYLPLDIALPDSAELHSAERYLAENHSEVGLLNIQV
jgi:hypothetical protein